MTIFGEVRHGGACLLMIGALIGNQALAAPGVNDPVRVERVETSPSGPKCSFNRVVIAPSMDRALIWQDPDLRFLDMSLARTDATFILQAVKPGATARQDVYQSNRRPTGFRWSMNGESLEALIERHQVLQIGSQAQLAPSVSLLDSAWMAVDLKAQMHGSYRDDLAQPDAVRLVHDALRARHYRHLNGFIGEKVVLFALDRKNEHLSVFLNPQAEARLELSPFAAYDLAALALPTGATELTFAGGKALADGSVVDTVPYERPFLDLQAGTSAGTYTPWGGAFHTVKNGMIRRFAVPGIIKHVSTSGDGLAVLFATSNGDHYLRISRGHAQDQTVELCRGDRPSEREADEIPRWPRSVDFAGPSGMPTFHGFLTPAITTRRSDTLIVRFHGGPLATILETYPDASTRRLSALGVDFLDVDYLGSTGFGAAATAALRKHGTNALAHNVEAVLHWARSQGYIGVTVVGESFGAGQAYYAAKVAPDYVRHVFLLAPLTVFDAERTMSGREFVSGGDLQSDFERFAFGDDPGRRNLSTWLHRTFSGHCTRVPVTVYLGALDTVAGPDKLAEPCQGKVWRTMVIENVDHASMFENSDLWSDLEQTFGAVPLQ